MAEAHWVSAISADFATAGDWSTDAIPGPFDDAILDAAGMNDYTVTASTNHSVTSIQTAATATLAVTGGRFVAFDGTGAGSNAGAITVGSGASFVPVGTVDNTGSITLAGTGTAAALVVAAAGLTLDGGGMLALAGGGDDQIHAAGALAALTNADGTIAGVGYLGQATLAITNDAKGVIDATGSLVVKGGANTIVNDGLLESTSGGTLVLASSTVDDTGGGTIEADNGRVDLQDTTVEGGTLTGVGAGIISANVSGSVLDGTTQAVTLTGQLNVGNGSNLTVEGSIGGKGLIDLSAGKGTADLIIGSAGATLSGQLDLSNAAGNTVEVANGSATLTNDGHITGSGSLGSSQMTLINNVGGVIDGTGSTPLIIDTGNNQVMNGGVIEATNGGQVVIESSLNGTFQSVGKLIASGGGTVTVVPSPDSNMPVMINGGTIHFDRDGIDGPGKIYFTGTTGEIVCPTDAGEVFGFSTTGGTKFDFTDIPFGSVTLAEFVPNSGNPTGFGTLEVFVGSEEEGGAELSGNYTMATFACSKDGSGGTLVQCQPPAPDARATTSVRNTAAALDHFVSAAASFGAPAVHASHGSGDQLASRTALAAPTARG